MNTECIVADIQAWPDDAFLSLYEQRIPRLRDTVTSEAVAARRDGAARFVAEGDLLGTLLLVPGQLRIQVLLRWVSQGWMDRREARAALAFVWSNSNISFLPRSYVVALFRHVGYVADEDAPSLPPDGPLVIYRGAVPEALRGLAWTTDLTMAAFFARVYQRRRPGNVYRSTIWPNFVLGRFDGRQESEVVVDPAGLRRLVELPAADWLHLADGSATAVPLASLAKFTIVNA